MAALEARAPGLLAALDPDSLELVLRKMCATREGDPGSIPIDLMLVSRYFHAKLLSMAAFLCLLQPPARGLHAAAPRLSRVTVSESCRARLHDAHIAHVAPLAPRLTSLDLSHCARLSDRAMRPLAQLSRLRELNLSGCHELSGDGLTRLSALTALRHLDLRQCHRVTDATLAHVAGLSALTLLALGLTFDGPAPFALKLYRFHRHRLARLDHGLSSVGLAHLCRLTALQHLDLSWCRGLTDDAFALLCQLPALQHFDVGFCRRVTDHGFAHVTALTRLSYLSLAGCTALKNVSSPHLRHLTAMQTLSLGWGGLAFSRAVVNMAPLRALRSLDLFRSQSITDNGVSHLAALPALHSLNLGECGRLTDTALHHVGKLATLTHLDLGIGCQLSLDAEVRNLKRHWLAQIDECVMCVFTDAGIAHLRTLTGLQSLSLRCCPQLTDAAIANIAPLQELTRLDVGLCHQLTKTALEHAQALTSLQALSMAFCSQVDDEGFGCLATLPRLRHLDLRYCSLLSDGGAAALLYGLTSLELLQLDCCWRLTEATFSQLVQAPSLRRVGLSHCLTPRRLWQLRQVPGAARIEATHYYLRGHMSRWHKLRNGVLSVCGYMALDRFAHWLGPPPREERGWQGEVVAIVLFDCLWTNFWKLVFN